MCYPLSRPLSSVVDAILQRRLGREVTATLPLLGRVRGPFGIRFGADAW